jgi:hypothetical protein
MEKIRLNVNITKEEHRKLKKVAEKYFLNTSDLITRSALMLQKAGISAISPPIKQLKSSMPKCITKQRDWV